MFPRHLKFPATRSFFLFGARGTGKSTLVGERFQSTTTKYIDLLSASQEERYARDPDLLYREAQKLSPQVNTIVIDEVQKLPRLLDVVHKLIFETSLRFVLTGSSARKLRQGAANMLAGRAFIRSLHPLTRAELGDRFELDTVLRWGSLPEIFSLASEERADYLKAYSSVYLLVRVFDSPFRAVS